MPQTNQTASTKKGKFVNINDLTIGQAKELSAMFGAPAQAPAQAFTPHIGKRCIVRTYASGVFCAEVVAQEGRMIELKNSRRLWSWKAADGISLSSVAVLGVNPEKCRFPVVVPEMTILDALEIIPASADALKSIDACKDASAQ